MKKKTILLLMLFALLMSGCRKGTTEIKNEQTQMKTTVTNEESDNESSDSSEVVFTEELSEDGNVDEDFRTHFNEFTLEGIKISLPCAYTELEALGFHSPESSAAVDTVGSFNYNGASLGFEENRWAYSVDFGYKDGRGDRIPLEEADIISFDWDSEGPNSDKFVFYGGINKYSTKEEVAQILDLSYEDEDSVIYCTTLDQIGYDEMSVTFIGDTISRIEIKNMSEYLTR